MHPRLGELGLGVSLAERRRQKLAHRRAYDPLRPRASPPLILRQPEPELDDATIIERVPQLDAEPRGAALVQLQGPRKRTILQVGEEAHARKGGGAVVRRGSLKPMGQAGTTGERRTNVVGRQWPASEEPLHGASHGGSQLEPEPDPERERGAETVVGRLPQPVEVTPERADIPTPQQVREMVQGAEEPFVPAAAGELYGTSILASGTPRQRHGYPSGLLRHVPIPHGFRDKQGAGRGHVRNLARVDAARVDRESRVATFVARERRESRRVRFQQARRTPRRDRRHGGRIEPTAQQESGRARGAQAGRYGALEQVCEVFDVLAIVAMANRWELLGLPVPVDSQPFPGDRQRVPGRKPSHRTEECALAASRVAAQELAHHHLVGLGAYTRSAEYLLQFRPGNERGGSARVVQRAEAEHIARTYQLAIASVPEHERELADQPGGRAAAPA